MHDLADMHDLVARPLGAGDADAFLSLAATNPLYFRHFPPMPTRESFLADLSALPPDARGARLCASCAAAPRVVHCPSQYLALGRRLTPDGLPVRGEFEPKGGTQ